jgi:hypothetical protein
MNALRRSIALLFVLFAATSLAVTATGSVVPRSPVDAGVSPQQATPNASANASITLENQTRSGQSVYVSSATLPDGGFVVLKQPGPNGTVVGVSLPLTPGTHEGKITLRGVPGTGINQSRLGANTTLVATLHRDSDGDDRFEGRLTSGTDENYTDNGTSVSDRARITIPDDERPSRPSVTLTNQTTRGTNATVDSVTLSEGGYVGIHRGSYNESNATESLIGATRYLEPGTYENVTVTVGAGVPGRNASALTDSGRVSAVVYEDTDDDRAFQYVSSGGVEDQPALANGTPVATSAFVTVERPQTETATVTRTATPAATQTPTPTETQTPTTTAAPRTANDTLTPYGGESNGREGILENPLFPLLVLVFAIFAVLAVVGR